MCTKDSEVKPAYDFKSETKCTSHISDGKIPKKPISLERKFHGYNKPPNFHIYSPHNALVELNEPLQGVSFRAKEVKYPGHEHEPPFLQTFPNENIMLSEENIILDVKHPKKYFKSLGYPMAPEKRMTQRKKEKKRSKRPTARNLQTLTSGTSKKKLDVLKLKTKTVKLKEEPKSLELIPKRLRKYSKNLSFRTVTKDQIVIPRSASEFTQDLQEAVQKASKDTYHKFPQVVSDLLNKQKLHPISRKELSDLERKKLPMSIQTCKFPEPGHLDEDGIDYWSRETRDELDDRFESKLKPILKHSTESNILYLQELQMLPDDPEHLHKRGKKIEETLEYIDQLQSRPPSQHTALVVPEYKGMMVKGVRTEFEIRFTSKKETHDKLKVVPSEEKEWKVQGKSEKEPYLISRGYRESKVVSLHDRGKGQALKEETKEEEEEEERERQEREGQERERQERDKGGESQERDKGEKEKDERERREREGMERGEEGKEKEEEKGREEGEGEEKEGEGEEKEGEGEEKEGGASLIKEADEIKSKEGKETLVSDSVTSEPGVGATSKSHEGTPVSSEILVTSSQSLKDQAGGKAMSKESVGTSEKSGMALGESSAAEKRKQDRASSLTDVEDGSLSKELIDIREVRSLESLKDTDKPFLSGDDGMDKDKTQSSEDIQSITDKASKISAESTEKEQQRALQEPEVSSSKVKFESPPTTDLKGSPLVDEKSSEEQGAESLRDLTDLDAILQDTLESADISQKDYLQMTDSDKLKKLTVKQDQASTSSFVKESSSQETADYETESQIEEGKLEKRKDKKSGKHKVSKSKITIDEDGEQQVSEEKQRKGGKKTAKRLAKIRAILPIMEPEKHIVQTDESELTFKKREKKKLQDPEYVRDFIFQRRSIAIRDRKSDLKKLTSETYLVKEPYALEKKSVEHLDEELEPSEESLSAPSDEISQESLFAEEQEAIQQKKASLALTKDYEKASTKQKIFVKLDSYAINPERFQKSLLKLKVNHIFDTLQGLQPQAPNPEEVTEFIATQHEDGKIDEEEYEALKETVEETYEVLPKVEPEVTPGEVVKPVDKQAKVKVVEKVKVLPKKAKSRKFAKRLVGKPRVKIEKKKIPAVPSEEIRRKFNWVAEQMRLLNELRIIHELTEPFIFSYYVNWPVMTDFITHKKKLKKEVL